MIDNFRENHKGKYIISFTVAWSLLLLYVTSAVDNDNFIYAIGQIHAYDHSLFNHNVYMGDGVISPRLVVDFLISLIMKINGGNWAVVVLGYNYFGTIVEAIAIAHISYRIGRKYQIICSALLTSLLTFFGNDLAGFNLLGIQNIGSGPAIALALLAISFIVGDGKRYNTAWIFAACAAVCHVHEGLYCCAVIFIVAAVDCILKKKVLIKENACALIAAAALALVILPSMFTDKMDISNELFVYIYSVFRHPHHLVPTSWGGGVIAKSGWINIFMFLLSLEALIVLKKKEVKRYALEALLFEAAWAAALAGAYIFTERIPLAFVSTMFLPKFFKFVVGISLIMFLKEFFEIRDKGLYFSGYFMLLFAFMTSTLDIAQITVLFIISAFVIAVEQNVDLKNIFINDKVILLLDVIFFALLMTIKLIPAKNRKATITVFVVFFAIGLIYFTGLWSKKTAGWLSIAACICMVVFSLYGKVFFVENGSLEFISGERALINAMGSDAYELALEFKKNTGVDEEFIADPDAAVTSGWVQIVSERNCYVVKKVIPSSKCTMDDWYERYMQTMGILDKELPDIEQIMRNSGIEYLLVDAAYYDKFDAASEFSVFTTSTQDSIRMYKLN